MREYSHEAISKLKKGTVVYVEGEPYEFERMYPKDHTLYRIVVKLKKGDHVSSFPIFKVRYSNEE